MVTMKRTGSIPLISPRTWAGLSTPSRRPSQRSANRRSAPNRDGLSRAVAVAQLHEGRVGEKQVEELAHGIARGLAKVLILAERRDDELPDLAVHALLHLAVQGLLGGKVVIEARDPDARDAGDVAHRGAGEALAREDRDGGAQDAFPGPIAAGPGGTAGPAGAPTARTHSTQLFMVRTRASATSR